ncbi:MAG: type II toxin-antitoxin system HicA family toxin [Clostridiales bacterium]|jgi:predicted RNA binding protein YcfA (HicA-like mRNA interferase family)|nr:type II toxin-antitoxin system HicA family toxin [Clostridiales bacterium]
MAKLKIVTSVAMCRLIENIGFVAIRQRGSHKFYRHNDGRTTVIPMHAKDLDRSLIRKILRDIEISIEEFNNLLS